GVDGQVAAVVVGDENRHGTMLERLSDQALLDQLMGDGTGHGNHIVEEMDNLAKDFVTLERDLGSTHMSSTLDLFTELCAIPSPPGNERAVTDRVADEL